MSERAEFEKSISNRFPGMDLSFDATGEYADLDACQHWETWQAARAQGGVPELTDEIVTAATKAVAKSKSRKPVVVAAHVLNAVWPLLDATPQPADGWIKCFCGSAPSIEIYEPCDDYPGNATANWCAVVECKRCRAHPKPLGARFPTEGEAHVAGKNQWNTFVSDLKRPNPPEQVADDHE